MYKTILLITAVVLLAGCQQQPRKEYGPRQNTLNLYLTVNCLDKNSWQHILNDLEKKLDCTIFTTFFSDGLAILEKLEAESDSISEVDLIIGIDNTVFPLLIGKNLLRENSEFPVERIKTQLVIDKQKRFIPFAHSQMAFIYDRRKLNNPPVTFGEIQDGIWKNKMIFYDPAHTSLGKATLIWSVAAFGENGYGHFWRSVKENIFRTCQDFDEGYTMFLAKQADLILALSTIPLYHTFVDSIDNMDYIIPREGGFTFIKGMGIYSKSENIELSLQVMEYLLSKEFQELIPRSIWMLPVVEGISLPEPFNSISLPSQDYTSEISIKNQQRYSRNWLEKWQRIMKD
ncbi:MAG: thiamine ABC transporter substrate-binding protein [Candidatus Cloacimonetes bacterium]|nr:thiamine ABC transporter substrate-binding protein [Candidatus Cloacimonadota bacterium]